MTIYRVFKRLSDQPGIVFPANIYHLVASTLFYIAIVAHMGYTTTKTFFTTKENKIMRKAKTSTVRARINPSLKKDAESLFEKLGLSTTEAITLFYKQVKLRNGLPFNVVIPNKVTRKILKDTDAGKNLVCCEDAEDMFNKLGI